MKRERKLLFSLTKKDFVVETFRGSGAGGQHRNKADSAVRIKHPASGAVAECQEERSQHQNKKKAFERLIASETFRRCHRLKCSELMAGETTEEKVRRMMAPRFVRIEGKDENGRWKVIG